MKYVFLLVLLMSGCAIFPGLKGLTETKASREAKAERQREQEELRLNVARVQNEGTDIEDFKSVIGTPSRFELMNGVTSLYYPFNGNPMIYYFKNKKLIGFESDRGVIADRKQAEATRAAAIQNWANSLPKTKNIDQGCVSKCTSHGYGIGICQDKCSY